MKDAKYLKTWTILTFIQFLLMGISIGAILEKKERARIDYVILITLLVLAAFEIGNFCHKINNLK